MLLYFLADGPRASDSCMKYECSIREAIPCKAACGLGHQVTYMGNTVNQRTASEIRPEYFVPTAVSYQSDRTAQMGHCKH